MQIGPVFARAFSAEKGGLRHQNQYRHSKHQNRWKVAPVDPARPSHRGHEGSTLWPKTPLKRPRVTKQLCYFSAVCTDVKVVLRPDPTAATTVMIATEIPAAISPYSIAVAPHSLLRNCANRLFMVCPSPVSAQRQDARMGLGICLNDLLAL
jgi:hypothetical protein